MADPAPRDFWKSAGLHLLRRNASGWLDVTPDYVRAYLSRPEVHPVEESCAAEIALYEALMADPFRPVLDAELAAIADPDAIDTYRIVLRFRDHLMRHGTIEGAYLALFGADAIVVPPVFLDQMVHLILRNCLAGATDPMRLKAAEIFFRDQTASLDDGRIMLADDEIVDIRARTGGMGGLGQLLVASDTPMRDVSLDVMDDETAPGYWARSDRFDMVVDFRFTEPAVDAFARVIEAWIGHFLGLGVRVQPVQSISDQRWTWHIGLDAEATGILNALYEGSEVSLDRLQQILALFTMTIDDQDRVQPSVRGKPVYLGLAMTPGRKVKMKPQNLLVNLPLVGVS